MSTQETLTSEILSNTEPLDDRGTAVRFESHCVVIPDPAHRPRRPRVVTKSYELPLWRRRASSPCPSSIPPEDVSEEHQSHVVLRLPLPTLSLRPHSLTRAIDHTPLPPCLVHRAQSPGPSFTSTPSLVRHTHTPRKPSPSRTDIITIPLRPCCVACQPITDAAFVGGDAWPEHFSRAASRRRSMSADGGHRTVTVAGSAASTTYGSLGVSINVDEVDKRWRSNDSTTSREMLDGSQPKEQCKLPSVCQRTASNLSTPDIFGSPSPTRITPATPRIPEEDHDEDENENELFPLPSPKRTPSTSPVPSPAGSMSSLMITQTNQCSTISPTPSTCSGESATAHLSQRHFLAPPLFSSSSSLSLPKPSQSAADLAPIEDPPRVPSPSLLSALPSLSGRPSSRSSSPRKSFILPTSSDTLSSSMDTASEVPQSPESAPEPIAGSSSPRFSQLSTSPHRSPVRFPWRSRRSVSADVISPLPSSTTPSSSLSTSPILPPSPNTKKAFSIPSSRHIIADMLRGVGAIGSSGGIGPSMHL